MMVVIDRNHVYWDVHHEEVRFGVICVHNIRMESAVNQKNKSFRNNRMKLSNLSNSINILIFQGGLYFE